MIILPKGKGADDAALGWVRDTLKFTDEDGDERRLYTETKEHVYVPRGAWRDFPLEREYEDMTSTFPVEFPSPLLPLRPLQRKPVSKMLKARGGILEAPTGSGKTGMMLNIAAALGERTLILVHTKDLLTQWRTEARKFLGIDAGVIGAGEWDEGEQVTIGMVQTLMQYESLPADWLETWGCVMHDEVHRLAADSFAHVMQQMTARYLYGATATVTRRDALHPIMEAITGPVVARVNEDDLIKAGALLKPKVKMVPTKFYSADGARMVNRRLNQWQRQKLYQNVISELPEDIDRQQLVARKVDKYHQRKAYQLVLSQRKEHLHALEREILARNPDIRTFVVTSDNTKHERDDAIQMMRDGHLDVLLATQLADEGLDIVNLSVLHLTFPARATQKLTQQVGRIMRTAEGKRRCVVLDYVDVEVPTMVQQATARWKWYALEKGCDMFGWTPPGVHALQGRIARLKKSGQLANKKGRSK